MHQHLTAGKGLKAKAKTATLTALQMDFQLQYLAGILN